MDEFNADSMMSPRRRFFVVIALTAASWGFPSALVYGVLQFL